MISYSHPDSANHPPVMSDEEHALYIAIREGQAVTLPRGHFGAQTLRLIADRIDCEGVAHDLAAHGVDDARVVDTPRYHSVGVNLGAHGWVDLAAGRRVLARIMSGMSPERAIARTLGECDRSVVSHRAILDIEAEADANERRLSVGGLQ